jgi:nitrate reductase gamma subunit
MRLASLTTYNSSDRRGILLTVLLWWILLASVVFVVGCAWRALKYLRAPEHLRWDLYPVAHEPGRDHGGSYFEEKDWWTKPRVKSHWGEASFMIEEIFLWKGVRVNNRKLWYGSLPFHWGLYLLVITSLGLAVAALGFSPQLWLTLLGLLGIVGGVLTAGGSLILLAIRSREPRLLPYTTPLDRLNLALIAVLGALSAAVAVAPGGMAQATAAVSQMMRLRLPEVSLLLGLQMAVAALFILYLPFTRMVHFFSKYFTYHQVRWDDRAVEPGSVLAKRLRGALDFGVDWSAEHIQTGKSWAEVATTIPGDDKKNGD